MGLHNGVKLDNTTFDIFSLQWKVDQATYYVKKNYLQHPSSRTRQAPEEAKEYDSDLALKIYYQRL
jgi:hypothetical protein